MDELNLFADEVKTNWKIVNITSTVKSAKLSRFLLQNELEIW